MERPNLSNEIECKLNQLEFSELRELIDNCIKMDGEKIGKESLELFTTNPNLLVEYANLLKSKIMPLPIQPQFSNPPYAEEVKLIYKRIDEMKNLLVYTSNSLQHVILKIANQRNYKTVRKHRRKVKTLQGQIETIKKETKQYEEKLKVKKENLEEYNIYLKDIEEYEIKSNKYQAQHRILGRIKKDIGDINRLNLRFTKLNWKILPKGEQNFHQLKTYLEQHFSSYDNDIDYEKIELVSRLNPNTVYCGTDEFKGYLVFYFEEVKKTVLDCPRKGNAIYIFGEEWKTLSCLTKSELLNYHRDKTVRIVHKGEWFQKLKSCLKNHHNKLT